MSSRYVESIDAIDPLDTMPPAKKSMVIFFLVDTSKSMEGTKLDSLNRVMGEILPELIICDTLEGVFVAGRNDTHIHGNIILSSHTAEGIFLKSPEDLGLHGKTHGIQLI